MSGDPIRAIATRYAGCHFRSRLEARWAVFFDALGIPWEYESQGFDTEAGPYLPDFWLPEVEAWIEVKGHAPSVRERMKFLGLASQVAAKGHRCRLLIGDIPREPISPSMPAVRCQLPLPQYVILGGGDVNAARVESESVHLDMTNIAGIPLKYWEARPGVWVPGFSWERLLEGLRAARSARFEHGQSGAT